MNKCKNCQWHNKPYWSIINPCDNCPNENPIQTTITIDREKVFNEFVENVIDPIEQCQKLQERIDKAIEYIMSDLITEWDIKNDGYVSGSDLPVDAIVPILNILQGDKGE